MNQVEKPAKIAMNPRRIGTVREAAETLKVPESWVYSRSRKNTIPVLRIGKYIRFDLDSILEWATQGCPKVWNHQ